MTAFAIFLAHCNNDTYIVKDNLLLDKILSSISMQPRMDDLLQISRPHYLFLVALANVASLASVESIISLPRVANVFCAQGHKSLELR